MDLFHIIDDGVCHLRSKGVYRQAKVYHRGRDVFAGYGNGFVKLGPSSGTSNPNVSWDAIDAKDVTLARVGGQPVYAAHAALVAALMSVA